MAQKNILYMCIAQYTKVLCDYSNSRSSFEEFTSEILQSIKPGQLTIPYQE